MLELVARSWWVYIVRGVLALVFGLFAYLNPAITMKILLIFFGIFIFIEGLLAIVGSIAGRKYSDIWWLVLLEGIAGVIIGVITFTRPAVTGMVLIVFVALWAIWSGLFRIITAIRLRKELDSEWLLIFGGIISILFGVMLFAHPGAGIVAIAWLIGFFASMSGILMITFGIKARKFQKEAGSSV